MDFTPDVKKVLAHPSKDPKSGGGYVNLRFVLKRWVTTAPQAAINRRGEVFSSFAFIPGMNFIHISANIKEFDLSEEAAEGAGIDAVTSKFSGILDADDVALRNLINEYNLNSEPIYALIDHCASGNTYQFGHGLCCPAMFKIGFKSGKSKSDQKGFPFTITVDDSGLVPIYRGVGATSREIAVLPDTSSIDVSFGTGTYLLPQNTSATAITGLANAVVDSVYVLRWDGTTLHSTIADGSTFHLTAAFTPANGAMLYLRAIKTTEFVEIGRHIPA